MIRLKLLLIGISLSLLSFAQQNVAEIQIDAGKFERFDTPVEVVIDQISINSASHFVLTDKKTGKTIPVQVSQGDQLTLSFVITDKLSKNASRTYILTAYAEKDSGNMDVGLKDTGTDIDLLKHDKKVLSFRYMPMSPPEGIDSAYTRSGYIHPVLAPKGQILTRIQAPDHYHHYGIWNPWTHTEFEGREVDFWNLAKRQGTVRFSNFVNKERGSAFSEFKALQQHVDLSAPNGPKVALNEIFGTRLWNTSENQYYMVDINSSMNTASESPLLIKEYRYAGLGFRAVETWNPQNTKIMTSEGKDRKTADSSHGKWCNIWETTSGNSPGILFMGHIQNYAYPEPMRIWPEDANGGKENIFFAFCPTKEADWEIKPGKTYGLKYRVVIYNGTLSEERIEQMWNDFNYPPKVNVVSLK